MPFRPEEWIFVGDFENCTHSQDQARICNDLELPIKGAILCNDSKHAQTEVCNQVPEFPSFCNVNTQICVSGLRDSIELFNELQELSDKK